MLSYTKFTVAGHGQCHWDGCFVHDPDSRSSQGEKETPCLSRWHILADGAADTASLPSSIQFETVTYSLAHTIHLSRLISQGAKCCLRGGIQSRLVGSTASVGGCGDETSQKKKLGDEQPTAPCKLYGETL